MSLSGNRIVDALPRADRVRLLAASETVPLGLSQVLGRAGAATRHVYFPTEGCISLIAHVEPHPGLEVGLIGREGMLGVQMVLGLRRDPLQSLVQAEGAAIRIPARAFADELDRSAALRTLLDRYVHVQMTQRAQAACCARFHEIGPRLARWLLASQDRTGGDVLHVTQEFLSHMLGVRREGITAAAGSLQRLGLIRYHRGEIVIVDRPGLLRASCSCYAAERQVHDEVMRLTSEAEPAPAPAGAPMRP